MEGGRLWRPALKAWPKRLGLGAWSFPAWRVQGGRVCKSGWQMPLCSWNRITYGVRPQHPLAGLLAWDGSPASQPASQASQASQPAVFTAAVSSGSETCPRLYYSDSLAGHPGDPLQYP